MSYPKIEREMYCEKCGTFFLTQGRYVRMSFDDPNDVDFDPEPCCPTCSTHNAVDADDAPQEEKRRRDEELYGDVLDDLTQAEQEFPEEEEVICSQ